MNFKKLIVVGTSVAMLTFGANAFAKSPGVNHGDLGTKVKAIGGGIDADAQWIPNGGSFGISAGAGAAKAGTDGFVINGGDIHGDSSVTAGGATRTDAYRWNPDMGDRSIGVGSSSQSFGQINGNVNVGADTDRGGFAVVGGSMEAMTGQGTLNTSGLKQSPIFFDTKGKTGGVALQGSVGGFEGDVLAVSSGRRGMAEAGIDASIFTEGRSYSDSYRAVDWNDGNKTEYMGTYVGADTVVDTYANERTYVESGRCWPTYARSDVDGGYIAGGAVATRTTQGIVENGGIGLADAAAKGSYMGAGSLNTNFNGYANGGSHTAVDTFDGLNGSVTSASAHMNVGAHTNSQWAD
jgi:hypothetical protein